MGREEATAVFCISEDAATAAATADPEHCAAVRRKDAPRSFLGLEVQLVAVPAGRVEKLVHEAWKTRAPKTLVKQHIGDL